MFRSINLSEDYLNNYKMRQEAQQQYQLTCKNMEKIKKIALKIIKYPEYKEAFDYVDKLFPRVEVKDVSIYKVAARDLEKMGYGGAEGFYDRISKIVVVCGVRPRSFSTDRRFNITAKIERDEVIVHELCHYCYTFEGQRSISREITEEFAYGWSTGYLKQKGYTDEQIVKNNFLPYLVGIYRDEAIQNVMARNGISNYEYSTYSRFKKKEFSRKYRRKVFDRAKEIAMERGLKLVDTYNRKMEEGTGMIDEDEDIDRFDILDL